MRHVLYFSLVDLSPTCEIHCRFCFTELKTSPTIHEQRQKLERAKMGDLLKAKIQQRPDRQELVRQHILEGNGYVYLLLSQQQKKKRKLKLSRKTEFRQLE